jgi:hypothetical protein
VRLRNNSNTDEPLLHHGQAKNLDELFGDARFTAHRLAGNPIFNSGNPLSGQELTDLKSYLSRLTPTRPSRVRQAGLIFAR